MQLKDDDDTNNSKGIRNSSQRFVKKTGGSGNQRKCRDEIDHSTVEIGWNTLKSPGDKRDLKSLRLQLKMV